jgi:ATP adenylyltransferase
MTAIPDDGGQASRTVGQGAAMSEASPPGGRLWTPWRMAYINDQDPKPSGCVFCVLPAEDEANDERNLILDRGRHNFVILNAYPYNPGHLMVAPYRHVGDYLDLTGEELTEATELTRTAIAALKRVSSPHGFNVGMNLGTVAGAGIADHVHLHVVPRWGGDTNFMPVIGQTKVLPELLAETWTKLRPHFAAA